jgi:hypothetical protein
MVVSMVVSMVSGGVIDMDELVGVSRKEIEVLIGDKVVDSELDVSMDLVAGLLDTELLRVEVSIHTSVYTSYMEFHGYCLNEGFINHILSYSFVDFRLLGPCKGVGGES